MKRVEFIVEADVPALLFSSKEAAEHYIESIDVEDGIYPRAFDRRGLVYNVLPYEGHGLLEPVASGIIDNGGLISVIRTQLDSLSVNYSANDNIDALLAKCLPYIDA